MNIDWQPGIGDPTVLGWLTVVCYFAAAIYAFVVSRHVADTDAGERWVWRGLALALLLLGINKQLDLQSALTAIGREMARAEGWYDQRALVQVTFVAVVGLTCLAIAAITARVLRIAPRATWIAFAGLVSVLVFVLVRAASFHHVDAFINLTVLGIRWNAVLELGGIALILIGCQFRMPHRVKPGAVG